MATLHNSVLIEASPDAIWDAARDVGALHSRLVPGFVVKTQLEGGRTTHYNAVLQVFPQGSGSRVEWTTDLLPNEMASPIQAMQEQALAIMKRTFESRAG
jgi:hypothetical protein